MNEINLKLKSYNELIFEISKLNTDNYLLKRQLEAYENMRKELLELILYYYPALDQRESNFKDELLNILNKVGGSDE